MRTFGVTTRIRFVGFVLTAQEEFQWRHVVDIASDSLVGLIAFSGRTVPSAFSHAVGCQSNGFVLDGRMNSTNLS